MILLKPIYFISRLFFVSVPRDVDNVVALHSKVLKWS